MDPHDRVQERSLRLHAAVVERLLADPALVSAARRRVAAWLLDDSVPRAYAEAWHALLEEPLDALVGAMLESSERMHDLRQVSPFAGVLDARTRWRILRSRAS